MTDQRETITAVTDSASARAQLGERRGLTGRWYRADAVDDLIEAVTTRLAAVTTELERMRRLNRQLSETDQKRRFGTLPTGVATERISDEAIQRQVDGQEAVDRILGEATEHAATIIREAREHHLLLRSTLYDAAAGPSADQARLERAETRVRELSTLLKEWTGYLVERDAADRRVAEQRSADLRAAHEAAIRLGG